MKPAVFAAFAIGVPHGNQGKHLDSRWTALRRQLLLSVCAYLAIDFSAACSAAAPGLLTLFLTRMSTGEAGLP